MGNTVTSCRARAATAIGEVLAPVAWVYAVLKLGVWDVDVWLAHTLAPTWEWLLAYRFFGLLAGVALLLILLGHRGLFRVSLFVLSYPAWIVFRIARRAVRRWPFLLAFAPAVLASILRLKSTFLLYTLATFSTLFIVASSNRRVVSVSMLGLVPLLAVHLGRSFQKSYSRGLLEQLIGLARAQRAKIETGEFPHVDKPGSTGPTPKRGATLIAAWGSGGPRVSVEPTGSSRDRAYFVHSVAQVVADKVTAVATRPYHEAYLVASWCYTLFLTVLLYGIAYFGIHRSDSIAFADAGGAGFWSFVGYSFGKLTRYVVSPISPTSPWAVVATYSEGVVGIALLVVLLSSGLPSARDGFRKDVNGLAAELHALAAALDTRARELWSESMVQVEVAVLAESPDMVNFFRRARGMPAFPEKSVPTGKPAPDPKDSPADRD